jgi:hypothetical protein
MLLVDGFQNRYDVAAVISNDPDLGLPIRMVRQILHKPVLVFNPHAINPKSKPSKTLRQVASQYRPIRAGALASSQFAPSLVDANGGFTKPIVGVGVASRLGRGFQIDRISSAAATREREKT